MTIVHVPVVQAPSLEAGSTENPVIVNRKTFYIFNHEESILPKRITSEASLTEVGHTLFVTQTVWHVGILFTVAVDYFLMTSTCASKFKEYTEHDYIAVCMYTVDRSLTLFKL